MTAMQFSGQDCDGNAVDLFADLDAGKAVILHFYMPSCGSCPPPASKIQMMANNINEMHPGMVKGYAFPFQNSTTCDYSATWVSGNNLSDLYAPMDSGAAQVSHYGGFGMPTVVLLGGSDHRVMFSSLSFSSSDTTEMRDSIMNLIEGTTGIANPGIVPAFQVFPNPADQNVSVNLNVKESSDVVIDILDVTGRQIALLMNEKQSGIVTKQFGTSSLSNGNYLIRMQLNGKASYQKLTVAH